jgi:hypothetical protein
MFIFVVLSARYLYLTLITGLVKPQDPWSAQHVYAFAMDNRTNSMAHEATCTEWYEDTHHPRFFRYPVLRSRSRDVWPEPDFHSGSRPGSETGDFNRTLPFFSTI